VAERALGYRLDAVFEKHGPHEGSLIAKHTLTVISDAVRLDELRVDAEQAAVMLVGGQVRKLNRARALSLAPSAGRK